MTAGRHSSSSNWTERTGYRESKRMARRAWTLVAAGTALFWCWLIGANAVLAEDEPSQALPLALVTIPLAVGAALTIAGGVAGARDPARRRERIPLWLAATAGLLELVAVVWGYFHDLSGSESGAYAIPLAIATLMLPPAATWAASARRFSRRPEAVREPFARRLERGWREATRSWAVMWSQRGLLVLPVMSLTLSCAVWAGGYLATAQLTDGTMPRIVLTGFIVLLVVFIVILFAVGTAGQVLALALYRHATGGAAIGPFTRDDLYHALVPRRRFRLRRRRE
jgi:hypothetical protein